MRNYNNEMDYKIMKKIYLILCNAALCILPLYSMEIDLSQSTIGLPEEPVQPIHSFNAFEIKQLEQSYKKQKNAIAKKQKANGKISLEEWKNYQKTLNEYNNSIPENAPIKTAIQNKLSNLTKNIQQKERIAELETFVAQSKEDRTIQDLQKYKTNLQTYLANLPKPNPEREKEYQEIIKHIDLINTIDEHMQIDYTIFTINELYNYLVSLNELLKQLHNPSSQRYKKLNNKITEVTYSYRDKIKERNELQLLEQKRLAQLKDEQEAQALNQQLDELINKAEVELDKEAQAKRKAMQQEQQKLEKEKIEREQQRRIDELIRAEKEKQQQEARQRQREQQEKEKLAQLERARLEQAKQEQQKLEQARLEQENAKLWIPWITKNLYQTRQTVVNFVSNITSTVTSWLSWLVGR